MSPVWVAFCVGLLLGAPVGIIVISLCMAAKRGDDMPSHCHCDHADQGRSCRECLKLDEEE